MSQKIARKKVNYDPYDSALTALEILTKASVACADYLGIPSLVDPKYVSRLGVLLFFNTHLARTRRSALFILRYFVNVIFSFSSVTLTLHRKLLKENQ